VITWPRDLQTMLQHFGVIKNAQAHIALLITYKNLQIRGKKKVRNQIPLGAVPRF